MRDGVRLHTLIFAPKDTAESLPILLSRTPYGIGGSSADGINQRYRELVQDGYIFVRQDIRGRYASEGQFVMNRPPRDKKDPKSIDESTDTYDTIDWLVKNVAKNNGRVGILGVSYDGWLAAVATIDAHPALKASSPQAPMTDTWLGDDFFHNGAFRETYGYEYVKSMESSKEDTDVTLDKPDAFDWYLGLGSLSKLTEKLQGKLPTWNAFVAHPNYDDYWKARAAQRYLKQTTVPTLVVGGWWDQEDFYGALATYEALEKHDKKNQNFVVLGPWNHGGWNGPGKTLGAMDFGSATGSLLPLSDSGALVCLLSQRQRQADRTRSSDISNRIEQMDHLRLLAAERGSRARHLSAQRARNFRLRNRPRIKSRSLRAMCPTQLIRFPIASGRYSRPTARDRDGTPGWWQDQRFLQGRSDVLAWQTEVLDSDLTISGDIVAHLFASTTGTDSDWVVKLIDVYPDEYPEDKKMAGYQLMIADEIFRGRFRQSFEKPAPIVPNQVNEYVIDLHGNNHCFKKGHRVMVQVQSTWFPLYDRNPQKFVENIFKAGASDYQVATQRVYESSRYPSHVTLPVMK